MSWNIYHGGARRSGIGRVLGAMSWRFDRGVGCPNRWRIGLARRGEQGVDGHQECG